MGFILRIKNYILRNLHLKQLKKAGSSISKTAVIDLNSEIVGKNRIAGKSELTNSFLGYASYIGEDCIFQRTYIGKYCSVGHRVKVIVGKHPVNKFVSTHPAFYEPKYFNKNEFNYVSKKMFDDSVLQANKDYSIYIGNDVWIGSDVRILGDITIGDGAIIGAGALITKDVEPYTVVGGIPAKLIRERFSHEQKEWLLNLKWWDKSEEWIREHADKFSDIEELMCSCKGENEKNN